MFTNRPKISAIVLFFIPFFIAASICLAYTKPANKILFSLIGSYRRDTALRLKSDIEKRTDLSLETTRRLAHSSELSKALESKNTALLQTLLNQYIVGTSDLDVITIFDENAHLVVTNTIDHKGKTISQERLQKIFDHDLSHRDIITGRLINNEKSDILEFQLHCDFTPALFDSSGLSVAFSVPIMDPAQKRQLGVVSTCLDFSRVSDLINNYNFRNLGSQVFLVSNEGDYFSEEINSGKVMPPVLSVMIQFLLRASNSWPNLFRSFKQLDHIMDFVELKVPSTLHDQKIYIFLNSSDQWLLAKKDKWLTIIGLGSGWLFLFYMLFIFLLTRRSKRFKLETVSLEERFETQKQKLITRVTAKPYWVPLAVLACLLWMTLFAWKFTENAVTQQRRGQFLVKINELRNHIDDGMHAYIDALYGAQGLFAASKSVERNEWAAYAGKLNLDERCPGIEALRFVQKVLLSEKEAFVKSVQADTSMTPEGYPDFHIHPEGDRDQYFVVKYAEPYKGHEKMLGYDTATDPEKIAVLEKSRDQSSLVSIGNVNLFRKDPSEKGFKMVLPVYMNGVPTTTEEERRSNFVGFVEAVIFPERFFRELFKNLQNFEGINCQVYDSRFFDTPGKGRFTQSSLIYQTSDRSPADNSQSFQFSELQTVNVEGVVWTLLFFTDDSFRMNRIERAFPWIVLFGGLTVSFLVSGILLMFAGSNSRAIELARNITKDLRESQGLLADMVAQAPDPIIILDLLGFVKEVNPATERISGYSSEELTNKHFGQSNILSGDSSAIFLKVFVLVAAGQERLPFEITIIKKDKTLITLEVNARLIRRKEKNFIQAIMRDVTEKKKMESQLLQAQKMETVGTLAGGIAHDLNNQLTPIKGYIELLMYQTDKDHPSYPLLSEANQSADRCAEVVRRLIDFSRPSTQKKTNISLYKLLFDLKTLLSEFLPATISIVMDCSKDIWPIEANESELESILMNLAINARDAMPDGGELKMSAENIDAGEKQSQVRIVIKDTGVGIPSEILGHIFEPFFTTKKKQKGAGLGLAMVFKTIQNYHGRIEVSSELGKGTVFQMYIPARPEAVIEETRKNKEVVSEFRADNETILFADDEEPIRNMGKAFLEKLGYKVLLAADGEEAVVLYGQNQKNIDALVLDMTMPKLTGRQAIEKILKINPKAKIIVASGYTSEGSPKELLEQGILDFVQKPYTIVSLAKSLKTVLAIKT